MSSLAALPANVTLSEAEGSTKLRSSYHPSAKSAQYGFDDATSFAFLLLRHPLICFSRVIADSTLDVSS